VSTSSWVCAPPLNHDPLEEVAYIDVAPHNPALGVRCWSPRLDRAYTVRRPWCVGCWREGAAERRTCSGVRTSTSPCWRERVWRRDAPAAA
jgi:hypothetical protein